MIQKTFPSRIMQGSTLETHKILEDTQNIMINKK